MTTTPDFRALLADDAYAASFQSMGQYRTALLKALATPPPEPPTDDELVAAFAAGIAAFPPQHPDAKHLSVVEYEVELEVRKARAVLERWGNS